MRLSACLASEPPLDMPKAEQAAVPRRHGPDLAGATRRARALLFFIRDKQAAPPTSAQWQRLGEAYNEGDGPADALVAWMQAHGMARSRPLFEKALAEGIAVLPEAPEPLKAFFAHVDQDPPWLDRARVERGVQAGSLSSVTGMRVLRDFGLMAGYQAGGINKTLVVTGALDKGGVARRIAETTQWCLDCTEAKGMERFGDGFKNTVRVRMIHALVRRHVAAHPQWNAAEWGLPINQVDMQATYLGFSAIYLLGQRLMGVILRQQEAEDVMHLWRYTGWLMGVRDEWLCASEQEGRIALYQNLLSQAPPDESSRLLGSALMDEPLSRHYPFAQSLRRRWDKQVHLSIVRLFVGAKGMRSLGLPAHVLPWYPCLFAPMNFLWFAVNRLLPGGFERLRRWGRAGHVAQAKIMFGSARPAILAMSNVKVPSPAP